MLGKCASTWPDEVEWFFPVYKCKCSLNFLHDSLVSMAILIFLTFCEF